MFAYLNKKIAIPNRVDLSCVRWNSVSNFIALGGEHGLVKVLELTPLSSPDAKLRGVAAQNALTMNQALEEHEAPITHIAWNETATRLTTVDSKGLVVIWDLKDRVWSRALFNQRDVGVAGVSWAADGSGLLIAYCDGLVYLGNSAGAQILMKSMPFRIKKGLMAPDRSGLLLVADDKSETVYLLTATAEPSRQVTCLANRDVPAACLVDLCWNAHGVRPLCLAWETGHVQLMTSPEDKSPVLVNTKMELTSVAYSPDGRFIAFGGSVQGETRHAVVQIYTVDGRHLHTLPLPSEDSPSSIAWDAGAQRIVVALGQALFFAVVVRPWNLAAMANGDALVYSVTADSGRGATSLVFWDRRLKSGQVRSFGQLIGVCADPAADRALVAYTEGTENRLVFCNSLGAPLASKNISFTPQFIATSGVWAVVAAADRIAVWQSAADTLTLWHADADPSVSGQTLFSGTNDEIMAIAVSNDTLVVARHSCKLATYSLSSTAEVAVASLSSPVKMPFRAVKLGIGAMSSHLGVLDTANTFHLVRMRSGHCEVTETTRTDCFDFALANDSREPLFVTHEKTRLYIHSASTTEEPVMTTFRLAAFADLRVTLVSDVLQCSVASAPTVEVSDDLVTTCDSAILAKAEELVAKSLDGAVAFAKVNEHDRVWLLIAHRALLDDRLSTAREAFARRRDYGGLQFVTAMEAISDSRKRQAACLARCGRIEEAVALHKNTGRVDLAAEAYMVAGEFGKALQLLEAHPGASDAATMNSCRLEMATTAAGRGEYEKAIQLFKLAGDDLGVAQTTVAAGDFETLVAMVPHVEDAEALRYIGASLAGVGESGAAAEAYTKAGDKRAAIAVCVSAANFARALLLCETPEERDTVTAALTKHTDDLFAANLTQDAVSVLLQSGTETAGHALAGFVRNELRTGRMTLRAAKHLFLAVALQQGEDRLSDTLNVWGAVTALHWTMQAQRNLHAGAYEEAVACVVRAVALNNADTPSDALHAAGALAAALCGDWKACADSLKVLELDAPREGSVWLCDIVWDGSAGFSVYTQLAAQLFARHSPTESNAPEAPCSRCGKAFPLSATECPSCSEHHQVDALTGQRCRAEVTCKVCHLSLGANTRKTCPCCLSPLQLKH